MKRRLFNAGALVSLLFALTVTALWVRSYWRFDLWECGERLIPSLVLASERGRLGFGKFQEVLPQDRWRWSVEPASAFAGSEVAGQHKWLRWDVEFEGSWSRPKGIVIVPHAALLLIFSLMPLWWLLGSRKKSPQDHCPACGYDLRGSPSGGGSSCPECGAKRGITG